MIIIIVTIIITIIIIVIIILFYLRGISVLLSSVSCVAYEVHSISCTQDGISICMYSYRYDSDDDDVLDDSYDDDDHDDGDADIIIM